MTVDSKMQIPRCARDDKLLHVDDKRLFLQSLVLLGGVAREKMEEQCERGAAEEHGERKRSAGDGREDCDCAGGFHFSSP